MQTAPDHVTRFYSDPSFALDVLENQKVALVRVTLLNDPFDPAGLPSHPSALNGKSVRGTTNWRCGCRQI